MKQTKKPAAGKKLSLFYLGAIVESSEDAIITKDLEGNITSWNKAAEKMYGYEAHEAIGQKIFLIIPKELHQEELVILGKLKKGERIEHFETMRVRKDKRKIYVSLSISPVKDTKGKIIGVAKIARDITAQKKAEERQQFLDKASLILSSSIDYSTTLKNIAKLIIPYLADYCRIVVFDENNLIKEVVTHHIDKRKISLVTELYKIYKDREKNIHGVNNILATGKAEILPEISEAVFESVKDNPKLVTLLQKLELQSYMGVPIKIGTKIIGAITFSSIQKDRLYTTYDLALAEELARRVAYAVENSRLYQQSQQSLAIRDEFISDASHELRTPVTSLKMYIQGLQKQFERVENTISLTYLTKMNNQVDKLTSLISDLLDVSRLQSGRIEFHEEFFDVNKLVADTVEAIKPIVKTHTINIEGEIPQLCIGDKDRVGQVLTNLITNAIKYSPKADRIVIALQPGKDAATITVKDFGIGIGKQHLDKIFNRFYRVVDLDERTFPGLGIGLYISNEIIKRHDGSMRVVSTKGKGSQFSFTLPYDKKADK